MSSEIQKQKNARAADAKTFRELTGVEATHLMKTDRAQYEQLRDAAGVLPGYRSPGLRINHRVETPAAPLTDQELQLMLKYSKAEVAQFYVSNGNVKTPDGTHILAKKIDANDPSGFVPRSPAEQLEIRNAAVLHGILEGTVRFPVEQVKPVVVDDRRINVGELGRLAGLPPEARVTPKQYIDLQEADTRRLAARSPSEVTQDRLVALRAEVARVEKSLTPAPVKA